MVVTIVFGIMTNNTIILVHKNTSAGRNRKRNRKREDFIEREMNLWNWNENKWYSDPSNLLVFEHEASLDGVHAGIGGVGHGGDVKRQR